MTIDIERLKRRCDHADDGDDPCDLVLDTRTVRELIAIAERDEKLKAQWQAEPLRKFARGIEKLAGITSGQQMAAEARDMADYIESGG